jgi:phosphoribosylamine--glycine ligase
MIVNGSPYVIEYNVRMGDPETQAVLPRLKSDLLTHLKAAGQKKLGHERISITTEAAVTVVAVSEGYPGSYKKGHRISGLGDTENVQVFHAGTSEKDGEIVTNGGRVLAITAKGKDITASREVAYKNMEKIIFEGKTFRNDIGKDLMQDRTYPKNE